MPYEIWVCWDGCVFANFLSKFVMHFIGLTPIVDKYWVCWVISLVFRVSHVKERLITIIIGLSQFWDTLDTGRWYLFKIFGILSLIVLGDAGLSCIWNYIQFLILNQTTSSISEEQFHQSTFFSRISRSWFPSHRSIFFFLITHSLSAGTPTIFSQDSFSKRALFLHCLSWFHYCFLSYFSRRISVTLIYLLTFFS